jgi:hypothetical protein
MKTKPAPKASGPSQFWPNGARMVVSVSLQMEAGAEPSSGAESPMPRIDPKYADLPATKWCDYGIKEGLPRLLDMFDRRTGLASYRQFARPWPGVHGSGSLDAAMEAFGGLDVGACILYRLAYPGLRRSSRLRRTLCRSA